MTAAHDANAEGSLIRWGAQWAMRKMTAVPARIEDESRRHHAETLEIDEKKTRGPRHPPNTIGHAAPVGRQPTPEKTRKTSVVDQPVGVRKHDWRIFAKPDIRSLPTSTKWHLIRKIMKLIAPCAVRRTPLPRWGHQQRRHPALRQRRGERGTGRPCPDDDGIDLARHRFRVYRPFDFVLLHPLSFR